MTSEKIKEQITTIKKATEKALKSKEAASKFLQDAGIKKVAPAKKK
jgi:hypothetical protein